MKIELLWFDGCPHHEAARWLLRDVLRQRGVHDEIEFIEVPDLETGERTKFPGSPTIRIDGNDIEPGFADDGEYAPRCRVYATPRGLTGEPERRWIEEAVERALAAG